MPIKIAFPDNGELYVKGAAEYIKIGNSYDKASPSQKVTKYDNHISFGGHTLYYRNR